MSFRGTSSVPRLKGDLPEFETSVRTVKEVLSTAIDHQKDLLGLVLSCSPRSIITTLNAEVRNRCGALTPESSISPLVLQELKVYIEKSLNHCQLALCSLQEINLNPLTSYPDLSPSTQNTSMRSSSAVEGRIPLGLCSKTFEVTNHGIVHLSPKTSVVTPLNPSCSFSQMKPLLSHPVSTQGNGRLSQNSAGPPSIDPFPQPLRGKGLIIRQQHRQEQNLYAALPAVDSDWSLLPEGTFTAPFTFDSSRSSRAVGQVPDHPKNIVVKTDQSYIERMPNCRSGTRISFAASSEARKFGGHKAKLGVVLQKLNDGRRGIPDDGHRGWKKYGNKSILNSTHNRGYYKCSLKDCRAKKMVQPTDTDPTLFEVTYVGKHSCSSSTAHPRNRHRSTQMLSGSLVHVGSNGSSEGGQASSTVNKAERVQDWKTQHAAAGMGMNFLEGVSNPIVENSWKSEKLLKEHSYGSSFFNTGMTTSTTASTVLEEPKHFEVEEGDIHEGEEGDVCMDTYLYQSSRHHQAAYSLWHDFDSYPTLPTG